MFLTLPDSCQKSHTCDTKLPIKNDTRTCINPTADCIYSSMKGRKKYQSVP